MEQQKIKRPNKRKPPIKKNGELLYHCTKCNEFKSIDNFEKRKDYDHLRSHCKLCRKFESAYYHRTVRLRMTHLDTLENIHICADPEISLKKAILRKTKNTAREKKLEHNITIEDIIIPKKCPILNKVLDPTSFNYNYSVDRVDNTKGYIKGNIKIISRLANTMKNAATDEELLLFAKNIKKYIKK